MADITVKGHDFFGVPDVTFPKVGGGTATFYENGGGAPNLQTKNKTYTPSGSQQTEQVHADNGYDGLDEVNVTVNAVPAADVNGTLHSAEFITKNGQRIFEIDVRAYCETQGWVDEGAQGNANLTDYAAIPAGTSVTPTESAQTIGDYKTMLEDEITVNGIPSSYVGSGVPRDVLPAALASTPSGTRKAVITQNADEAKYLNIPAGYNSAAQYYELPQLPVGPKTITENGIYDAFALDELLGYSSVLVNVSMAGYKRVKTGTYTPDSTYNTTGNRKITDITEIGFTPSMFVIEQHDRSVAGVTQYAIVRESYEKLGNSNSRVVIRYTNTSGTTGAAHNGSAWTTQSNYYLYFDGTSIYIRTTSAYLLPAGVQYDWMAIE